MKRLHLFHFDKTICSYTYPIVKIALSAAVILLLIFRERFIHINQSIWKIIGEVVCAILGLACILCIEISIAEIITVHDNKSEIHKHMSENAQECVILSVDRAVSLIIKNDIIDFEIISDEICYHIGASSDNKPGDSYFFDKRYYIGNQEYKKFEDFYEHLIMLSFNGQIQVVSIDGVSPNNYP